MKLSVNQWGGVQDWEDRFGRLPTANVATEDMVVPALRLIRYDDTWRPLGTAANEPLVSGLADGRCETVFEGIYGGERRYGYGACPSRPFPAFWPAAFDTWPAAADAHPYAPMRFRGNLVTEAVQTPDASGIRFTLSIRDQRTPSEPGTQGMIRMPVGIEIPLPTSYETYGTEEIFEHYTPLRSVGDDPSMRRAWYYLEGDLFGLRAAQPMAESPERPYQASGDVHIGSPFAAFSENEGRWWAVASEADYGAAVRWGKDRMRFFSTLYLQPGGEASWSWVVWRGECREPSQLLLQCTREGGFFDQLNPREFKPAGAPPGPVLFANVSRLPFQMDQIRALQPGLVFLNYHYDHISSTANLYGEWTTYEGFQYSEQKLKRLIADLRSAGVPRVGVYGTQVEQPESHKALRQDDIVLDAWGRRFHAWEPGNWVVDGGNRDCGERLARAEAEFCHYYGLDAVFVDRLDHLGTNANPARQGKSGDQRLMCVPSIRLGMIELNKQRMAWMRKLNPALLVGLNNTTGWAGVRYSDWNQLEGGNRWNREIPWLYHPSGVVDKRHATPLFAPAAGADMFQAIDWVSGQFESFADMMRTFIGESLFGGVEACPYGDEWFVDPDSMFFTGGNSKYDPDEVKLAKIQAVHWTDGAEWRRMWEAVKPALDASRELAVPPCRVTDIPDQGALPADCALHARAGEQGGIFAAVRNNGDIATSVQIQFHGFALEGEIPAHTVRVWWGASADGMVHTLVHRMCR